MKLTEELVEKLLVAYREELPELEGVPDASYIKLEDFMLPQRLLEDRLVKLWEGRKGEAFAHGLKEYSYSVKRLYRIYCTLKELSEGDFKEDGYRKEFLEKVAEHYARQIEGHRDGEILKDPSVTYVLRRLGLQNRNEQEFVEVMEEMFRQIDGSRVWDCHKLRIGTYREACADLFMALSLNMTAFGYCSQVFHTISAARLQIDEYDYENINYARLRVIAAVLLWKENHDWELETQGGTVAVNGERLLAQGDGYCLNTLKCIQRKLEESEKGTAVGKKKIGRFLGAIYGQIQGYLENPDGEAYRSILLCPLLNHGEGKLGKRIKEIWEENQDVVALCQDYKHLFWRIECFLMGLSYIMEKKVIRAEEDIYNYMKLVCDKACKADADKGDLGLGCCWENSLPKYLLEPKKKIGQFYNEPEKLYTERPEQKLENTIDFIQNYYYHNRFRLRGREIHGKEKA